MKQTAVDWLFEQVVNRTERVYFLKELEQAKKMEQQQIIDAYYQIGKDHQDMIFAIEKDGEQYYNETFNK